MLTLAGAVLVAVFSPLRAVLFGASLAAVIPGEVYRSGQPSVSTLERWIDDYGLRTVVNLQGTQRRKPWAVAERETAEARGLDFHFLRLHPKRLPSARDLRRLLELIETSPRPILFHCRLGVDRSGLAAATALLAEGRSPRQARQQLSLAYGHSPWLSGSNLLAVVDDYERWLDPRPHTPERFRSWVQAHYVPDFYRAHIERIQPPSTVPAHSARRLHFRVTNTSPRPWSPDSKGGVFLGARLRPLAAQTDGVRELRHRGGPLSLAPGEQQRVELTLPNGLDAGRYAVTVDMVHEGRTWFAPMGSEPLQLELELSARR